MFRLRSLEGEKWCIVDLQDEKIFVGSCSECEDWLDRMENMQGNPTAKLGVFRRFLDMISTAFSKHSQPLDLSRDDLDSKEKLKQSRDSASHTERVSN